MFENTVEQKLSMRSIFVCQCGNPVNLYNGFAGISNNLRKL